MAKVGDPIAPDALPARHGGANAGQRIKAGVQKVSPYVRRYSECPFCAAVCGARHNGHVPVEPFKCSCGAQSLIPDQEPMPAAEVRAGWWKSAGG